MKSRNRRIMGEIQAILNQMKEKSRMVFGMAAKMVLVEQFWNDSAPTTGFESISEELVRFQAGFSELNREAIISQRDPELYPLMEALRFISETDVGKKRRPRDISKKLNKLRDRTRKSLKRAKVPRFQRGTTMFFFSLTSKYIRTKRINENWVQVVEKRKST